MVGRILLIILAAIILMFALIGGIAVWAFLATIRDDNIQKKNEQKEKDNGIIHN